MMRVRRMWRFRSRTMRRRKGWRRRGRRRRGRRRSVGML